MGELLCGNVSYATLQHNASWRWPMAMCGVAVFAVSVAVLLLIKEPPVGKFYSQRKVRGLHSLCCRPAECMGAFHGCNHTNLLNKPSTV